MIKINQLLTGQQGDTVGSVADGAYGGTDTAVLLGNTNVLTGGDENFLVGGITSGSVVTLGNGADAVGLIGDNNIVTLGAVQSAAVTGASGADVVASLLGLGGTADLVALIGSNNSLTVAGAVDALLAGNNNSMSFGDRSFASPTGGHAAPAVTNVELQGSGDHIVQAADAASGARSAMADIWGGSGNNYVSVVGNAQVSLDGQQNTIIAGGGSKSGSHFDITAGSGQDYVTLANTMDAKGNFVSSSDTVRLSGTGNQVSGGSDATISGGSGGATLDLGTEQALGRFDVDLGGKNNSVTLHDAVATELNAGKGSATVNLLDSSGNVSFAGSNNMLFIGGSAPGPIVVSDSSTGLRINLGNTPTSPLEILGNDKSLMIDLAPGVGNLSAAAQITKDLHSDGAGGTVLSTGTGNHATTLIHFVGDAHVTAANFTFG